MDNGTLTAVLGFLGVALTAAVGLATGMATARSNNRKNAADTYAKLVDDVQGFAKTQLDAAEKKAEEDRKAYEARLCRLEERMKDMQKQVDRSGRQVVDAVRHIRVLQSLVPGTPPPPPASIARAIAEGQ